MYFEYDPHPEYWQERTGKANGKKADLYTNFLKEGIDIVSWYFDYDDGSFLFIDENHEIFLIEVTILYN